MFDFFWGGDFFQSPAGLGEVSAMSPSVATTSRRLILSATGETSPRPAGDQGDWGDIAATSPRRCLAHFRDHVTERVLASRRLHSWSKQGVVYLLGPSQVQDPVKVFIIWYLFLAETHGDLSTTLWRRRRNWEDVSETSPRLPEMSPRRPRDFRANWLSLFLETSWRRLGCRLGESASHFWSTESPELPRLISRGSRGDVSANEIGP